MLRVRFTAEYVAGIIAGTGAGLVIHPLLERWLAPQPTSLSIAGVILACCGGFMAFFAQRVAARTSSTRT